MMAVPIINSTAFVICTHDVAVIPPKTTYTVIKIPTTTTLVVYGMPSNNSMSAPAPTSWAII